MFKINLSSFKGFKPFDLKPSSKSLNVQYQIRKQTGNSHFIRKKAKQKIEKLQQEEKLKRIKSLTQKKQHGHRRNHAKAKTTIPVQTSCPESSHRYERAQAEKPSLIDKKNKKVQVE